MIWGTCNHSLFLAKKQHGSSARIVTSTSTRLVYTTAFPVPLGRRDLFERSSLGIWVFGKNLGEFGGKNFWMFCMSCLQFGCFLHEVVKQLQWVLLKRDVTYKPIRYIFLWIRISILERGTCSFSQNLRFLWHGGSLFMVLRNPKISIPIPFYHLGKHSRSQETLKLCRYCWWKKSCTTRHVWNPVNNGTFTTSTGAGFLPPTVLSS